MISGSNYKRCQVPFHSTISVVYTDLLQRRQMMVMMICGLPRYETAEGKLLKKLTTQIEQRLDYMAGVSFIDFLSKGYK